MRVLVIGGGGIVGQEMIRMIPDGVDAIFTRTSSLNLIEDLDIHSHLDAVDPSVLINLSGQNNVDVVESNPDSSRFVNEKAPEILADWARKHNAFLIQGSTQGVFSGSNARYKSTDIPNPITQYGTQKRNAEIAVSETLEKSLIARLTFVYGIRPEDYGRANPLEVMMSEEHQLQVNDRFFSPLWSKDAASILWDLALEQRTGFVHLGQPIKVSRYDLACHCAWETARVMHIKSVSHEFFKGLAPRPVDTTWDDGSLYKTSLQEAIMSSFLEWSSK